jgi:hypothetical protein
VLSLRLLIVAGLSGIALWGLFSLLDQLREPKLLHSEKALIVTGCEHADSKQTMRLCPQLFCQKALLDARALLPRSKLEVTVDATHGGQRLIGGIVHAGRSGAQPRTGQRFACIMRGNEVRAARVIDAAQLDVLSGTPGNWVL